MVVGCVSDIPSKTRHLLILVATHETKLPPRNDIEFHHPSNPHEMQETKFQYKLLHTLVSFTNTFLRMVKYSLFSDPR